MILQQNESEPFYTNVKIKVISITIYCAKDKFKDRK